MYAANLSTNRRIPGREVTVTQNPTDTFTFEGGSVRIRSPMESDGAVDAYLVCPNLESIVMTLVRN